MSLNEDEQNDLLSDNMELDEKVNIEETTVNFTCVKKELDEEFEFEETQYKVSLTYENLFGKCSIEQGNNRDSLIGFLDGEIIMKTETGTDKIDVKEEVNDLIQKDIEQLYCNKCGGNYEGYCPNCSSLSHILNNITANINPEPVLNTAPINTVEIREISGRRAVFSLKTLPKGIIIGPFEGIPPIESTNGLRWKIKVGKFVNDQNGNWMKYIERVTNHALKNLDVFQIDGILYFETSREIQEGEELLVGHREEKEEVLKSDEEGEFYLVPVKKEEYPKVFACTFCCLGFRLEICLVEHKSKCLQGDYGGSKQDFEIIQCSCCKMWLEKREHVGSHVMQCLKKYNRLCHNLPDFQSTDLDEDCEIKMRNDEISTLIDGDVCYLTPTEIVHFKCSHRVDSRTDNKEIFQVKDIRITHSNTCEKEYKCSQCTYQTNDKWNLKRHINTHMKPFECNTCKKRFSRKSFLKRHAIYQHLNKNGGPYKCSECSYQSNYKNHLKAHFYTHNDSKPFECDICKKRFCYKLNLKRHIGNKHSNTSDIEYKCPKCSYETNFEHYFKNHLSTHRDMKPFECDICKKRFCHKVSLKFHMKDNHSNTTEKDHKCSKCSYQTNYKSALKIHLTTHSDVKPFKCDICKMTIRTKSNLRDHIRNQHTNKGEKEYKCNQCSYQTNRKRDLKVHVNTHNDIKPFECDICKKRFTQKCSLKLHIENKHSNKSEKEYQCTECSFQTTYKGNLKIHLNNHNNDIKQFECDFCKTKFNQKGNLRVHIKNKHSNTNEQKHKCSECPYQTNYKNNLKTHLNTHNDIKPFVCDVCKNKFSHKSSLNLHNENEHSTTNELKNKCSECSYQTNYKSNLKKHLNTHKDIKPFECDICEKRFCNKYTLSKHIKNNHSNTNEKELQELYLKGIV